MRIFITLVSTLIHVNGSIRKLIYWFVVFRVLCFDCECVVFWLLYCVLIVICVCMCCCVLCFVYCVLHFWARVQCINREE